MSGTVRAPLGMLLRPRLNGRLRLSLVNHLLGKGDCLSALLVC